MSTKPLDGALGQRRAAKGMTSFVAEVQEGGGLDLPFCAVYRTRRVFDWNINARSLVTGSR
jgi:hypothetical protein